MQRGDVYDEFIGFVANNHWHICVVGAHPLVPASVLGDSADDPESDRPNRTLPTHQPAFTPPR